LIQFVQPLTGGECGGEGMFAHNWNLRWAQGHPYEPILMSGVDATNYTIQSGLGGRSSCDPDEIMPIGILAHELGHGLGQYRE
jgi:hypothetical protein